MVDLVPPDEHVGVPAAWAFVGWCLVMAVVMVAPLRYAGVFESNHFASAAAEEVTLGHFNPLRRRKPLEVGQCLEAWKPRAVNMVVACGEPHRSEVLAELDGGQSRCPSLVALSTDRKLHTQASGPFGQVSSSRWCVVSSDRRLSWRGQLLAPLLLPHTL